MKPDPIATLRDSARSLLTDVETELAHTDAADDQIGKHAEAMDAHAAGAMKRSDATRGELGYKPDDEATYLYLAGQRRRAAQVRAMAKLNARRGHR